MNDGDSSTTGMERLVRLLVRRAGRSAQLSTENSSAEGEAEATDFSAIDLRLTQNPVPGSALGIINDLADGLSGSRSKMDHDTLSERRAAVALLRLAVLSTDSTEFESISESAQNLQSTIQQGIEKVVADLEAVDLHSRAPEDLSVVLFFFEELSQIPRFCSAVENVGHNISKEVLRWLGKASSLAEHDPIRLGFWLKFLERCSSYTWMDFRRIISPEDLYTLCMELSRHKLQKSVERLLFNLSENENYDDITSLYMREILNCALDREDAQEQSSIEIEFMGEKSVSQGALVIPSPSRAHSTGRSRDYRSSDQGGSRLHHSVYSINRIRIDSASKISNEVHPEASYDEVDKLRNALSPSYQRFVETLAVARLERHREVLQIRLGNANTFIVITSLLIVAQVVYSSLLFSRKMPIELGRERRVEVTWTIAMALSFASVLLGFANAFSAFSFTQAIGRALETAQQILDIQTQAHDWLVSRRNAQDSRGEPLAEYERFRPRGDNFIQVFSSRVEKSCDDAMRLDHVVREHIHDGSKFALLLLLDMAIFLVSVLFSAISTHSLSVWLPLSIILGLTVFHISSQEVKHRPGEFIRKLRKLLPSHVTRRSTELGLGDRRQGAPSPSCIV